MSVDTPQNINHLETNVQSENCNVMPDEFQQMREQLKLLQQRLDQRVHFEESMLKKAMQKNASNLFLMEWGILIVTVVAFILVDGIVISSGLSLPLCIFTAFFMLILVFVQLWSVWFVSRKRRDLQEGNLLRVSERLVLYKKLSKWSHVIFVPISVLWTFWYLYESAIVSGYTEESLAFRIGFYTSGIVGGIIGGSIGWIFDRKMMGIVNEMQQQIKDLKDGEE